MVEQEDAGAVAAVKIVREGRVGVDAQVQDAGDAGGGHGAGAGLGGSAGKGDHEGRGAGGRPAGDSNGSRGRGVAVPGSGEGCAGWRRRPQSGRRNRSAIRNGERAGFE